MTEERRLRRDNSKQYEYDITSLRSENDNLQATVEARDAMIEKLQGQIFALSEIMDDLEKRVAQKEDRAEVLPEYNELRKSFEALSNMVRIQGIKYQDLQKAILLLVNDAGE